MDTIELLTIPHKRIRSLIIKEYLSKHSYKGCVCFSCGNASDALKKVGINTIAIADNGDFIANRWFTPGEVYEIFTNYFDATSGHLPIELMNQIALYYREHLKDLPEINYIPSGSGETLVCLKIAFPNKKFIAVYNLDKTTEYDSECILNDLVKALAADIIYYNEDNILNFKEKKYEII